MGAKWTREDSWSIKLPAGARITAIPPPSHIASAFGHADVSVDDRGNLRVTTLVSVSVTRVTVGSYPAFRAWCESVDRALGLTATVVAR